MIAKNKRDKNTDVDMEKFAHRPGTEKTAVPSFLYKTHLLITKSYKMVYKVFSL